MDIISIIEKKKQCKELTSDEIAYFINGAADATIPDYQLSALLMAIRLNGMTREETASLTMAMSDSGSVADLSAIDGVPTDKHSTGGVGDTTTLVLVPLVAACGVPVAKMSGRGLGHTGGTLDKLESIQNFKVQLGVDDFIRQVQQIGCAVVGQTDNLAPADKVLYALRDVTATVDSLPLIAGSIMSKKLASGAQAIVLDVKTGSGALMHTLDESIQLAQAMVRIGCDAGRNVVALVTDMDEPLGLHIGNALEVKEAIDILSGRVTGHLLDVSLELGAQMLLLGGVCDDVTTAKQLLLSKLQSGEGLQRLKDMITAQGGDCACCDEPSLLPTAKIILPVPALHDGYIEKMDTIALGNTAQNMGAGRKKKSDVIDHSVGFVLHKRIGDAVAVGEALATVHAKDELSAQEAINAINDAITISSHQPKPTKMIHALVDADCIHHR